MMAQIPRDDDGKRDGEFCRAALFRGLRRGVRLGFSLLRAAIGAKMAGGVNRLLAIAADVHRQRRDHCGFEKNRHGKCYGSVTWPLMTRPRVTGELPTVALK